MVEGAAGFDNATFGGATRFLSGSFEADASFRGATFRGDTQFFPAFEGAVRFDKARFEGAVFLSATFQHVGFYAATFEGAVTCFPALTCRDASFESATFAGARDLGPVLAEERLVLDRTVFAEPVRIEASAQTVSCARAQFRGGADLLVRRAEVTLDDADFGEPSLLAPRREPVPEEEPELSEEQAPRVLSLRRAKVANLTIAGADLSACRFEGAHGLDRLRLEQVRFAETPRGRRWTRRQVIAEEQQWRASGDPAMSPAPGQIAAIYRALRKGREDGKDEPGAADFYYGEMEMRRQRPRGTRDERRAAPAGERLVLWLYWLVSGYGLRASRALISLALTVLVFAFLFDWWGFRPDQGFGRTLLFSIESTSSLFRVPETRGFALTAAGELMQVALRLLGPLFFGLALFSLRGRVKR